MKLWMKIAALAAASAGLVGPAPAALAQDQGADRQARLIEAAKKEGEVSLYYIFPNLDVLVTFTNKYGVAANVCGQPGAIAGAEPTK